MPRDLNARRCRYTFDLERSLRREFEAACAIQGLKRSEIMLQFVKRFVEGNRQLIDALALRHIDNKEGA